MIRLLDLLRSERSLVAGALGSFSDQFGWNRARVRIIGFFIIWGSPYCLGASIRNAWWISILIYVGFALIIRKLSCASRYRDSKVARRWRERRFARFANQANCRKNSGAAPTNAPSEEKEGPVRFSMKSAGSKTGNTGNLAGEQVGDALSDLEQRLVRLDQRIQKMESAVTDRSFDWDRRLRRP